MAIHNKYYKAEHYTKHSTATGCTLDTNIQHMHNEITYYPLHTHTHLKHQTPLHSTTIDTPHASKHTKSRTYTNQRNIKHTLRILTPGR